MRAAAFAGVGLIGFAVQLVSVGGLTGLAGWPPAAATAFGVEAAVLHNFVWHWRWTWRDRTGGRATIASQLLRFQLANGMTSLAGNVLLSILLARAGLNAVVANAVAVGVTSVANFALADRWVFVTGGNGGHGGTRSQEQRRNGALGCLAADAR
jgi:putative flippase GtrA